MRGSPHRRPPQNPLASCAPSSHSTLRIEPSEATTTSTSSTVPSERRAARTCPSASPSRPSTATPVRRSTPASNCIFAAISPITPPSAPTSGALPRSATVTGRSRSRHTEAISDPTKPEPTMSTRRGRRFKAAASFSASSQVRTVNRPSSAASCGLNQGRARVPVAISNRSYSTRSPLANSTWRVDRSRPTAATPNRHCASTGRSRGSFVWCAGTQPLSTCLDSGGRS
ncbi:hypothetical protein YM3MPS_29500 [Mycobacterium pseudoshottsii]|nr:hypothetical protein YM3MPS_29500 [Mycobacterium pseudoshottsii]